MSSRRSLWAAAAVVGITLATLVGCAGVTEVATKTDTVLTEVKNLPGVIDSFVVVTEHSAITEPLSIVHVTLDDAVTADEVTTVITTFARANLDTGVEKVSSRLELDAGPTKDTLELAYDAIADDEARSLAATWLDLRARYGAVDVSMFSADVAGGHSTDVTVALGGEPGFDRDIAALVGARQTYAALGTVGRYEQSDGRFGAVDSLPDDAAIAILQSLHSALTAAAPESTLAGVYGDVDGYLSLLATLPITDAAADPATGLPAAIESAVDAIPPTGPAVEVDFADPVTGGSGVFLDTRRCDRYLGLADGDLSRALLLYWARDGRALLDGSTAASCFAG